MGGVNSNRPPDPKRLPFEQEYHDLRSQFRATGKGLMVALPDNDAIALNQYNANGILRVLKGEGDTSTEDQIQYLFVDNIKTSWNLSGSTGQSQSARTFYPRNLTQSDLIISGTMANQYEYDKLVVFIREHQKDIVQKTDVQYGQDLLQVKALEFTYVIPEARAGSTYHHGPRLIGTQFDIAVTNIKAGHEKFKFAPAFTLTCKVVGDRFHGLSAGEASIIEALPNDFSTTLKNTSGLLVFGTTYTPTAKEEPNYALEATTQRPRGVGTAGQGANPLEPGNIDEWDAKFAAQGEPGLKAYVAANAPNASDLAMMAEYRSRFSGCFPADPTKQYFFSMGQTGPNETHTIKWRDPPNTNTTSWNK